MWQNVRARVPATTTSEGSSPTDERIGAQLPGLKKSVSHLQEKAHIFQHGIQGPPLSKWALCLYSESLPRFLPYSSPTQTLHACRRWRMYFHFNPDILNLPLDFLHQSVPFLRPPFIIRVPFLPEGQPIPWSSLLSPPSPCWNHRTWRCTCVHSSSSSEDFLAILHCPLKTRRWLWGLLLRFPHSIWDKSVGTEYPLIQFLSLPVPQLSAEPDIAPLTSQNLLKPLRSSKPVRFTCDIPEFRNHSFLRASDRLVSLSSPFLKMGCVSGVSPRPHFPAS